jgi:purine nucleosidase
MMIESPHVEVMGITIVAGDVARDEGMERATRGLAAARRSDIPVIPGAIKPLLNSAQKTSVWESLYGKLEWKGFWSRRAPHPSNFATTSAADESGRTTSQSQVLRTESAAEFLVKLVHQFPGAVTIVATGPMTNIALAQLLDPDFASLAKELVYMGGSLNPRQVRVDADATSSALEYINSPRREFNFRFDPEAANIALQAPWRRITMVPVDPSTSTELTDDVIKRMSPGQSPLAQAIRKLRPGRPLWDEIAAGVWLEPAIVSKSEELLINVDTQFGPGYGDTLSWRSGAGPDLGERRQTVVHEIDCAKLEELMARLLAYR